MDSTFTLFLDLDGVLITTPIWKPDEIDSDGYSKFEKSCVENLNKLLSIATFEICLTSSRRKMKTLNEFNSIFKNRSIDLAIKSFLPVSDQKTTRKDAIQAYIKTKGLQRYLVIDDDKSLSDWDDENTLVQTAYHQGFNTTKLLEAIKKVTERP